MVSMEKRTETNYPGVKLSHGFTMVEISIATVFVGIVIMTLSATFMSIIHSYNRGIWMSQIYQTGQQLNSDILDKARYGSRAIVTDNQRLCIGGVTYAWNTESQIRGEDGSNQIKNRFTGGGNDVFSLARIKDQYAYYCKHEDADIARPGGIPVAEGDKTLEGVDTKYGAEVLLDRGAVISQFDVKQYDNAPILKIDSVLSTGGENRPTYNEEEGVWQCGFYDGSNFTEGNNQFCSYVQYSMSVYERSASGNNQ